MLGKNASCQTPVSLALVKNEVLVIVGLRLFVPESWMSDPPRLDRAGAPKSWYATRSKPEIALAQIDRLITTGERFGTVLADAGCGLPA